MTNPTFDLIIRGGTVYDGSGGEPFVGDIAVLEDKVDLVRAPADAQAETVIDATGLAVAPGFINMLSHSYFSILQDPRSLSELRQGVTTQIFGEGHSMGPITDEQAARMVENQPEPKVEVPWRSLAGYLAHAESFGVSQNVASYIGATSLRAYVIGLDDRPGTPEEIEMMRAIVRDEMSAGALGIGSSLIYPPAFFAPTEELIELCQAAAPYRGKYISHMRNEGNELLEGIEELIRIGREGGVPAEIYHLKAGGVANWPKMEQAIELIESARAEEHPVTADMYTYTAGGTGLSNAIPPWFHDGGPAELLKRLEDQGVRKQMRKAIEETEDGWENLYKGAGGGEGVMVLGVRKEENRQYQGKTLTQIAEMMGKDDLDALMDLVLADRSRIDTAYFMMSDANVARQVALPWMSFGSDAQSIAAEGPFLNRSTHPRAYGNFARLLAKYVRDEQCLSLAEAVRKLTRLAADNLELEGRGRLEEGYYADIVVFDPATIQDHATYEDPHQYATGVRDVVVNGTLALRNGEHTGAFPGRALYGPGKK